MRILGIIIQILDDSSIGKPLVLFYSSLLGAAVNYFTPIEVWIDSNGGYIGFMMYAIALDFLLGIISGIAHGTFKFIEIFGDLGIKLLAVFGFGILFEGVKHIHNNDLAITEYLLYTVRMMVFLYPVFSASKRMSEITGGVFPPIGWFKWMDNFKRDLKIKKPEDDD